MRKSPFLALVFACSFLLADAQLHAEYDTSIPASTPDAKGSLCKKIESSASAQKTACPNCPVAKSRSSTVTTTSYSVSRSNSRGDTPFMLRGPVRRILSGVRGRSLNRRASRGNCKAAAKLGGMQSRGTW